MLLTIVDLVRAISQQKFTSNV